MNEHYYYLIIIGKDNIFNQILIVVDSFHHIFTKFRKIQYVDCEVDCNNLHLIFGAQWIFIDVTFPILKCNVQTRVL